MRIIVFVTQKGGCGKSTLAACLAVAAQEAGERVFILDMDPKQSLVRWGVRRKIRNLPVRSVSAGKLPAMLNGLTKRKISLAVLDTPALELPESLAAIGAADLLVVPARPASFDIWASEVTGRKLRLMNKEFVFLLNQCPSGRQAAYMRESIAMLEAIGPLLSHHVHVRTVYLDAAVEGKGVTEVNPKGSAAREMRAIWLALKRRLPQSRIQQ